MRIRPAVAADIPALIEVELSAGLAFRDTAHAWIADDVISDAAAYEPRIAAGAVWAAEDGGQVVGVLVAGPLGAGFHIWEIDVRLDRQKRGFGRALMQTAVEQARARGLPALTLTTFADVPFNAPFYASLGFVILPAPPPELAQILAGENARGLTNRVAMRLALE